MGYYYGGRYINNRASFLHTIEDESNPKLSLNRFWNELVAGKTFVVMDTETTGLSAQNADVIEVSAIKVKLAPVGSKCPFEVLDTFDSYVNPGYSLPEAIVEFNKKNNTGICDEFLADKPDSKSVANALQSFFQKEPAATAENAILVGHNLESFDVPFIEKLMLAGGHKIPFQQTFDTYRYAKQIIPFTGKGTHTLGTLHARTEGIFSSSASEGVAHTSIFDCLMTLDLTQYFTAEFEKARQIPSESVVHKKPSLRPIEHER